MAGYVIYFYCFTQYVNDVEKKCIVDFKKK